MANGPSGRATISCHVRTSQSAIHSSLIVHPFDGRNSPPAVQDFVRGPIHPHEQIERVTRCREPVRFLILAWRNALYVNWKGTVGIELQLVSIADRVAMDRVLNKKLLRVVHRDGPESARRRELPFFKTRSEEHTSELQSQSNIACRLLLVTKK